MTPDLVIFDCDGVLVDTEVITNRIIADNLTGYGLPIAPDECHTLFSGGTMQGAMADAKQRGARLPDNWLDEIYAAVFAGLSQGLRVMEDLFPLLEALDRAGIQTCIASNGPPAKMDVSLKPSGLLQYFEGRIYSGHTHGAPKPAPDMLLIACEELGVTPDMAMMIDDSPAGLISANRAGIRAIGFDETGNPARLKAHTTEVVPDMATLQKLIFQ